MADTSPVRPGLAYEAIVRRMQPDEAIAQFGFPSRQAFHNQVTRLVELGVVRRATDTKARAHWDGPVYPFEPTGRPLRASGVPEGTAVLETYPAVAAGRDRGVRVVRWKQWVIQGVPVCRLDGSTGRSHKPPNDRIPNLWVVVLANIGHLGEPPAPEDGIVFLVSVWHFLLESDVRFEVPEGLEGDLAGLTEHIALAVDVDAVLDVTRPLEGVGQ